MKIVAIKAGAYHVTDENDKVLFEILFYKMKIHTESFWVFKKPTDNYAGLKRYRSLTILLQTVFPFGFTNAKGKLKKIYDN